VNHRSNITRPCAAAAALLAMFTATNAGASQPYSEEVRAALDLSYTPACTLCHGAGADAGTWLVDTAFGKSMLVRGLRPATQTERESSFTMDGGTLSPSLVTALERMRSDGVDSDGDGAEDLDELVWKSDPNTYDGLRPNPTPQVSYGCQVSHRSTTGASLVFACFGISLLRASRSRAAKRVGLHTVIQRTKAVTRRSPNT